MTATMDRVISEIEALSSVEKSLIAQYLIMSLDDTEDVDASKKWAKLAKSRYESLKSGETKAVTWDTIKQTVLAN